MKMSTIRGMATGLVIGSAAFAAYGMMNARTQRKLKRFASASVRKTLNTVSDWFA